MPNSHRPLVNRQGQPLHVWYLSPHDLAPGDAWGYDRGPRIVETLSGAGCTVTYYASTFAHMTKKVRGGDWERRPIDARTDLVFVPVRAYLGHGSMRRMLSLLDFAKHLVTGTRGHRAPDLIVVAMPTPFLDLASLHLARRHGARLVHDFRDLWPELFVHAFAPRCFIGWGAGAGGGRKLV